MSENYRLVESVGSRLLPVESYQSVHIHHPSANAAGLRTGRERDFERPGGSTSYPVIQGEHEEVRTVGDNQYVKKDMIFLENGSGNTHVPAPVQGYVYFTESYGQASIYDKLKEQGGELIARVMHLKPETFRAANGSYIEYGQPLAVQGQTGQNGRPDPAHYGIHAHIEFHVQHLDQFDRFIKDVNSGVIAPNKYPALAPSMPYQRSENDVEPATQFVSNQVPARYTGVHGQLNGLVGNEYTARNIDWGNGGDNTVAACTVACAEQNISDVQVLAVVDGNINMGQKNGYQWKMASVDATQAARTPQEESFAQLVALDQQQSQKKDNPVPTQTKTQTGPSMT